MSDEGGGRGPLFFGKISQNSLFPGLRNPCQSVCRQSVPFQKYDKLRQQQSVSCGTMSTIQERILDHAVPLWESHQWPIGEQQGKNVLSDEGLKCMTCLEVKGIVHCKWYDDLVAHASGANASVVEERIVKVVAERSEVLRIHIIEDKMFVNYAKFIIDWEKWCNEEKEGDLALRSAAKLVEFLNYRLPKLKDQSAKTKHIYVKNGRPWFDRLMVYQGYAEELGKLAKEPLLNTLVKGLKIELRKERKNPKDVIAKARNKTKRYNKGEKERMAKAAWDGQSTAKTGKHASRKEAVDMRRFAMMPLNAAIARRGFEVRNMRENWMFKMDEMEYVRPAKCIPLGMSLQVVKEGSTDDFKELLVGVVRSKNRSACPVGAMALYKVWGMDVAQEDATLEQMKLDLQALKEWHQNGCIEDPPEPKWWARHLFHANDATSAMTYRAHEQDVIHIHRAADVTGKTAKTHMHRNDTSCMLLEMGETMGNVAAFGNWSDKNGPSTLQQFYREGTIVLSSVVKASGWRNLDQFECWWEGEESDIPPVLLRNVFPSLDETAKLAEEVYELTRMDLSAVEYCRMLKYLRKVFIEDAVEHLSINREFPAYRHPIFKTPEWEIYAAREVERVKAREQYWRLNNPMALMVRDAVQAAMADMPGFQRLIEASVAKAVRTQLQEAGLIPRDPTPEPPEVANEAEGAEPLLLESNLPPTFLMDTLEVSYSLWQSRIRPFLDAQTKRPWKEWFGDDTAQKNKYLRGELFFRWLDTTLESKDTVKIVVMESVEEIMSGYHMTLSTFITRAFYFLVNPPITMDQQRPPKVAPGALAATFQNYGLPLPESKRPITPDASVGRVLEPAPKLPDTSRKRKAPRTFDEYASGEDTDAEDEADARAPVVPRESSRRPIKQRRWDDYDYCEGEDSA
jgi:hypothetical protein